MNYSSSIIQVEDKKILPELHRRTSKTSQVEIESLTGTTNYKFVYYYNQDQVFFILKYSRIYRFSNNTLFYITVCRIIWRIYLFKEAVSNVDIICESLSNIKQTLLEHREKEQSKLKYKNVCLFINKYFLLILLYDRELFSKNIIVSRQVASLDKTLNPS